MKALRSKERDNLHLLERTNFDLQVQNSIVPSAYSLARFKLSGHLPTLQVNMSDTKYKALMRLIDVAIPHFDDDDASARVSAAQRPSTTQRHTATAFKIPSGFFGTAADEYAIDTDDEDHQAVARPERRAGPGDEGADDEFFEADPGAAAVSWSSFFQRPVSFLHTNALLTQDPALHQHVVEIDFKVDTLRASLYKYSAQDGAEKPLGDVAFQGFGLTYAMEKYVMKVGVDLR